MTDKQLQDTAKCVFALQQLAKTSGTHTERTQGHLLRPLSPEDLTKVALLVHNLTLEAGGAR